MRCTARREWRGKIYRCYSDAGHRFMHRASRAEYKHHSNWDLHWEDSVWYAFPSADGADVEARILAMGAPEGP